MISLNKRVTFLVLIFLIVSIFSCWTIYIAYAASARNVTVAWDYPDPPTDLAGFDLRINGDNSTIIDIPKDSREWTGPLTFYDGNNTLDMRAKDLSGQVSLWSEPCYYDPIPSAPSKVIVIKITINIH